MERPAEILLTDGLGAYQGMARDLKRPIIHAIHIHKPPFTRLVVRRISYDGDGTHRLEITAATKTNILTRQGKREVHYIVTKKYVGPPRKRGRKKGQKKTKLPVPPVKNGLTREPKKRGPKYGLGTLHKRGRRRISRWTLIGSQSRESGGCPPSSSMCSSRCRPSSAGNTW